MKPPSIVIDHFLSTKWSKKLFTINHYELQNGKCIVTQELSAYDIEELLARIETILRRIYENQYTSNSLLCCGDLNLDTIGIEATLKNQKLPLTKNEFAILKMLMEHPQQVFTKDMIYEQLWNEALEGTENAINVHISNLRKKIAAIDNSKSYIKTVWGIGFKMDI